VPGTYPPEPVNGLLVAGFDSPVATRIDPSFVYPRDRYDEVSGWGFADFQEGDIGPGWHAHAHAALLQGIARKEAICTRLYEKESWDFAMVVFGEADTASHHFWLFHDPESPRHRPGMEHAIRDIYVRLDQAVGRLCDAFGADTLVAVVSDHGFGGAGTGVVHLNNWLAQHGHLHFARTRANWLKALALRVVPVAWRGALFRRLSSLASHAEGRARFDGIDWAKTRAWSEELSYFPTIRINRDLIPEADYDAYVRALCDELMQWDAVAQAWPRAEIYSGPMVDHAPDIVLELALENGYSHTPLRARGGPPFRRLQPSEYLGGKERGMNGTHRDPGVVLLSQPADLAGAGLQDIAPTVLAAMGVPAPPMEGRSLLGASPESDAAPQYTSQRSPPPTRPRRRPSIEERLRALGYFE
jgi:predicted AlkP superfamily phosphohydrolase/phosphomutase